MSKRTIDYDLSEAKRMIKVAFFNNRVSGKTLKVFEMTNKLLKAGENTRTRVLEIEEYISLHPNLPRHAQPLVDMALFTGMRPGELIQINRYAKEEGTRGLTWDRVDFKNRVIILEPEDTKTKEAPRIPITDEIFEILRKIPRDLRSNHVFNYAGIPLTDIRFGLKSACEKTGIPFGTKVKGGFVFRDLRTTADTFMVRAGVPDVYRRALLGHKQQGMDRHYVHPDFEKDLREAMAKYTGWLRDQVESGPQSVPQVPYFR